MKRCIAPVVVGVFLVLLAGCSSITSGIVSDKVIEPKQRESTVIFINHKPVYRWNVVDPKYCFTVTDGEESEYICIDKYEWDKINEGDYYEITGS